MVHMKPSSVCFCCVWMYVVFFLRECVNDYITHLDFNECVLAFWPLHDLISVTPTPLLGTHLSCFPSSES